MSGGKIVLAVFGALFALLGLALLIGGGVMTWVYSTERNSDGYLTSSKVEISTETFALTSQELDLGAVPAGFPSGDLATVQISAESRDDVPVFVGIGAVADVTSYLDGVAHAEVSHIDFDNFDPTYRISEGGAPGSVPSDQTFWTASASGDGLQQLTWDVDTGEWIVVIMNADASPNVDIDVFAGAKTEWFLIASIVLLIFGLALAVVAVVMLIFAFRKDSGELPPAEPSPSSDPPA